MQNLTIAITGGNGYLASQLSIYLARQGHSVVSTYHIHQDMIPYVKRNITGGSVSFVSVDLVHLDSIRQAFNLIHPDVVIHLAGIKGITNSILNPLDHYYNTICGTLNLLQVVKENHIGKLVFSSSGSVYGETSSESLKENSLISLGQDSPYSSSKSMIERILKDFSKVTSETEVTCLRIFNAIGYDYDYDLSQELKNPSKCIMKSLIESLIQGKLLIVSGGFNTKDGTSIRDYIDVKDIFRLMDQVIEVRSPGYDVYNVGSGVPMTTIEVIELFESVFKQKIQYETVLKTDGMNASQFSNNEKVMRRFNWKPLTTLEDTFRRVRDLMINQKLL